MIHKSKYQKSIITYDENIYKIIKDYCITDIIN